MTTTVNFDFKQSRKIGKERDQKVIAAVEETGSLAREQIEMLFFGNTNKCRERLTVLTNRKKLKRGRCDVTDSYIYWIEKKPGRIEHRILQNWIYVAARGQGFTIKAYIPEYYTGEQSVQPDALFIIADGSRYIPLFIEFQRIVNNSTFDKVTKYTDYFLGMNWTDKTWAEITPEGKKRFNRILVVTDGNEKQKAKLKQTIDDQNVKKLRFIVATLQEIMTDLRKVLDLG